MPQINALNCNKTFLGLGFGSCEIFTKALTGFILVPKGWSISATALNTFTLADAIELVQRTTWDIALNADDFTQNTPEPTTKDYTGGKKAVIRNGLPEYSFEFNNGIGFHKAAYSKNSFRRYDVLLLDDGGNIIGASSVDGLSFTGFPITMFNTRTYQQVQGDNTAATIVDFQIADEEMFNSQMTVLTKDNLGFNINQQVNAIQSVTITVVGTPEAGDPIVVNVNTYGNSITGIESLTTAQFMLVNNTTGAEAPATVAAVTGFPGRYSLTPTTPTTSGQTYVVYMYDSALDVYTAILDDDLLYKGASNIITVSA